MCPSVAGYARDRRELTACGPLLTRLFAASDVNATSDPLALESEVRDGAETFLIVQIWAFNLHFII